MNKNYGYLICPDTQIVGDVCAAEWTHPEMQKTLRVSEGGLLQEKIERTGDTLIVSAFLNVLTSGKPSRREGFELYGERFYGPALIIASDENRHSPVLDPQEVSHVIRFFRPDPPVTTAGQPAQAALAHL